jgi:D-xylose transport system permease protein
VAPLAAGLQRLGGGIDGAIGATASWAVGIAAAAALAVRQLRVRADRRRHGVPARAAWAEALHLGLGVVGVLGFVAAINLHTLPRSEVARGIPIPVLILVVTAGLVHALARHTRFGRHVFAVGGSPRAALRAGVRVPRLTVGLFATMGALAGVAGVLTAARLGAGTSSMGTLSELAVIAAAVIGGTRLAGGVGSVPGAVLGAVLMQSLENGLLLMGVSSAVRQVGIGLVLVGAVWIDASWQRRADGLVEEAA